MVASNTPAPLDTGAVARKVLIIEDDPAVARSFRVALVFAGFTVEAAANGEDGLRYLQEMHPDAVVLDVNLPGMDGFAVLDRMRHDDHTPVIMMSGYTTTAEAMGRPTHPDAFLEKPATPDDLIEHLNRLTPSA